MSKPAKMRRFMSFRRGALPQWYAAGILSAVTVLVERRCIVTLFDKNEYPHNVVLDVPAPCVEGNEGGEVRRYYAEVHR